MEQPFQRAPAASPDPDPETPLVGPASSPVEADCVGEPALPSSVHEDSVRPLRRSTREGRPPKRFRTLSCRNCLIRIRTSCAIIRTLHCDLRTSVTATSQ